MKFISLFNPVSLDSDPPTGNEGDLYYNSVEKNYRIKLKGIWTSLINEQDVKILLAPEIFNIGISSASAQVILEQYHSENVIYCVSASYTKIVIPEQSTTNIHTGSRISIIRGSDGTVEIVAPDPEVNFIPPSNIYLTKKNSSGVLLNVGYNNWILSTEYPDLY